MHILGKDIKPGTETVINFEIAKLYTRSQVEIPIIINRSKQDGPVLLLIGGIHGDEVNGIEIVRRIIAHKINQPTAGTIICIPVMNIFGFLNLSRQLPDGRDLNRSFPGSKNGSLAAQLAYTLSKHIVPFIDVCIDFHTGGADRMNFPQARYTAKHAQSKELALNFNAPFVLTSTPNKNSLRSVCDKANKAYFVYEAGKTNSFDEYSIDLAVQGTKRVMDHLGMRPMKNKVTTTTIQLESSRWVRASYSGLFHPQIMNGDKVRKGQELGVITDLFGEFNRIVKSSDSGYIICVNTSPVVNKGDALFHIGFEPK